MNLVKQKTVFLVRNKVHIAICHWINSLHRNILPSKVVNLRRDSCILIGFLKVLTLGFLPISAVSDHTKCLESVCLIYVHV